MHSLGDSDVEWSCCSRFACINVVGGAAIPLLLLLLLALHRALSRPIEKRAFAALK